MFDKSIVGKKIRYLTWGINDWYLVESIDNDGGAYGTVYHDLANRQYQTQGYYIGDAGWVLYVNFNEELDSL